MFRRRRSFGRRFGARRSVGWIPGASFYTPALWETTQAWFNVLGGTNIWGTATQLTVLEDLQSHGGEDAVLTRITGRILVFAGQVNAGAGLAPADFFYRLLVVQQDNTGGGVLGIDYTTGAGLGRDSILFFRDGYCSRATEVDSVAPATSLIDSHWVDVEVKAKRKLEENKQVFLWIQSAFPVGTTGVQTRFAGGLRALLKRPR